MSTPIVNARFIDRQLATNGEAENVAATVGERLSKLEDKLIALYAGAKKGESEKTLLTRLNIREFDTVDKALNALQIKYQRAQRTMQIFTTMMRNAHQMMMELIRNLRV